jgi:hypothetical protein
VLVFLHLLERDPERGAELLLAQPKFIRRSRMREPTCASIGDGRLFRTAHSMYGAFVKESLQYA